MYCPECGGEVDETHRYCQHCGEEVNPPNTGVENVEPIDRTVKVEHQCISCGEMVRSGEPPCRHCGGMDIETRPIETATGDNDTAAGRSRVPVGASAKSSETSPRDTQFYLGAVIAVAGVILFPFVFVFVALPESIAGMFGRSIQNTLGEDARNNPFISGSFLILRWFGNFLILLFILGFIIGVMLAF